MLLLRIFVVLIGLLVLTSAQAEEVAPKLPRYASLASNKVYLRQGPAYAYRILWVYQRKGLPVLITEQYDIWRKVVMPDGAAGWVHWAMLSGRHTVMVTGKDPTPLHASDRSSSRVLALAAPGVIATLDHCGSQACEVRIGGRDGWIAKDRLWGIAPTNDRR